MRCSWSNAPQPITSTAADTGGHVDRVHLDASLCWMRMERLFHSGFFVWCSTDLPCSTGTRAGSYSGSRGVLERDGQTPCTWWYTPLNGLGLELKDTKHKGIKTLKRHMVGLIFNSFWISKLYTPSPSTRSKQSCATKSPGTMLSATTKTQHTTYPSSARKPSR